MNNTDVTVIIVTYNSDYQKTINTINSVLNQINCNYEIIIADDGSSNDNFKEIINYFDSLNYSKYKLLGDGINRGTVTNLYNALQESSGRYIKPISPGDYLYSNNTLSNMLAFLDKKHGVACFGKAFFYSYNNNNPFYSPYRKHPYFIKPYLNENSNNIRNNYLVMRDPILGAALLYEKGSFQSALSVFNGKVKYCEDSALNLMAAKYQAIVYLEEPVIFYEANTGISSRRHDKWSEAIYKDNQYVFSYLLKEKLISENEYHNSFPTTLLQKITIKLGFSFIMYLKRKLDRRYKITMKMPKDLFDQMKKITSYN